MPWYVSDVNYTGKSGPGEKSLIHALVNGLERIDLEGK